MIAIEDVVVVGEVGDVQVVAAVVVVVADRDAHVGLRPAVGVERRARRVADVGEPAAAERCGRREFGPESLATNRSSRPSSSMSNQATPKPKRGSRSATPAASRHVGEGAVAIVAEQVIGRAGEAERAAHDRLAPVGAVRGAGGERPERPCRRPAAGRCRSSRRSGRPTRQPAALAAGCGRSSAT